MDENLLSGIKKVTIEIDSKNLIRYKAYIEFLENHIEKGHKIPARVLKRFISLFKYIDKNEEYKKHLIQIKPKVKETIIERFFINYSFSGSLIVDDDSDISGDMEGFSKMSL